MPHPRPLQLRSPANLRPEQHGMMRKRHVVFALNFTPKHDSCFRGKVASGSANCKAFTPYHHRGPRMGGMTGTHPGSTKCCIAETHITYQSKQLVAVASENYSLAPTQAAGLR